MHARFGQAKVEVGKLDDLMERFQAEVDPPLLTSFYAAVQEGWARLCHTSTVTGLVADLKAI
jgi:hypothetical protein